MSAPAMLKLVVMPAAASWETLSKLVTSMLSGTYRTSLMRRTCVPWLVLHTSSMVPDCSIVVCDPLANLIRVGWHLEVCPTKTVLSLVMVLVHPESRHQSRALGPLYLHLLSIATLEATS